MAPGPLRLGPARGLSRESCLDFRGRCIWRNPSQYRQSVTAASWDGFPVLNRDLRSMIFLDEEEEEDDYGSWAKQPVEEEPFLQGLPPEERDVISRLDKRARRYSKRAGKYRAFHIALGILSIVAAAFVPVAIAVGVPNWIPAVLGAIAATAQSILQLTHVDQRALELHLMLVRLTSRRDELKVDVAKAQNSLARSAFVDTYEREAIALMAGANVRVASLDGGELEEPK